MDEKYKLFNSMVWVLGEVLSTYKVDFRVPCTSRHNTYRKSVFLARILDIRERLKCGVFGCWGPSTRVRIPVRIPVRFHVRFAYKTDIYIYAKLLLRMSFKFDEYWNIIGTGGSQNIDNQFR
jgi:hypothetical protein